jgi:3-oxoacyl-[acyl-carrier-protein] synthase-3
LAVAAAEKLFAEHRIDRSTIDYLLFCTQTPDYSLPTTACLLQERLGLPTGMGALDFNLGCSGFVYGLSLADGLIQAGAARRILFLTAETYTKMIHPSDRSLRTIFGDAAAATLIEAHDTPTLSAFQFGTDGSGANTLIASRGGFRPSDAMISPRHRKRWPSDLYMDGPSLMSFTVGKIPDLVNGVCERAGIPKDSVKHFLFHQATRKMLEQLQSVLELNSDRLPIRLEDIGNTVSCTLPILIQQMRDDGTLRPEDVNMLVGFGVGWSWAGCMWRDVLGGKS